VPLPPRARAALLAAFLMATLFLASMPVGDGDYYWHIAQGRAIVERGELPTKDLFTYTQERMPSTPAIESAALGVLQQSWLAQVALYLLHAAFGEAGVVALRAAVYTLLAGLVYLLASARANRATGLLFSLLLVDLLLEYPSERPTLFSFVWCFATLLLLERFTAAHGRARTRPGLALAGGMWLWANTHGSFTLGVFFIASYAAGHLWSALAKRERPVEAAYLLPLLGAMLVTLLNPRGIATVTAGLLMVGNTTANAIHEFVPPFLAARDFQEYYPAYWIFLALTVVGLVVNRVRLQAQHLLVLTGLLVLSLSGIRYMVYLLLAAPIVASYPLLRGKWSDIGPLFPLLIAGWFFTQDYRSGFSFGPSPLFPVQAAGRLDAAGSGGGELFNFYDWGGYLSWRVPGRKVFIDGRNLHPDVAQAYQSILWSPAGEAELTRFGVSQVLVPGMSNFSGKIFPLVRTLSLAPNWRLVYANGEALLFQRTSTPKSYAELGREQVKIREHLEQRARTVTAFFLDNPGVRLTAEIAAKQLRGLPVGPRAGVTAQDVEEHQL
jgi:hypothetical protein